MKFLKYVSYSIEYMCSEVQLPASPLCFSLSHSVAVAALSEISHVACRTLQVIHFELFLSPSMRESLRPPNSIIFQIRQLKQYILGIDPRRDDHSFPLSTARLLFFFTNLRQAERCLADGLAGSKVFSPSQRSPNFAFHEPAPDLTC